MNCDSPTTVISSPTEMRPSSANQPATPATDTASRALTVIDTPTNTPVAFAARIVAANASRLTSR